MRRDISKETEEKSNCPATSTNSLHFLYRERIRMINENLNILILVFKGLKGILRNIILFPTGSPIPLENHYLVCTLSVFDG